MNETLKLIESRRSHRAYEKTPLTDEQIRLLMKAAVESPSAVNRQPWHFTMVRDQELIGRVNSAAKAQMMLQSEKERSPRMKDPEFDVFYHAPAVLFISGMPGNSWTQLDCGIACENVVLAAESLGLGTVILGLPRFAFSGPEADDLRRALRFPEGWDFAIAVAIGTPADDKPAHPVGENKTDIL